MTASGGEEARAALPSSFRLTREMLAAGLCADLGSPEADAREFQRRAREVLRLFSAAGVAASYEDPELTARDHRENRHD